MRDLGKFLMWFTLIFGVIGGVLYATLLDVWTLPSDDEAEIVSVAPNLAGGDVLLLSRHGEPHEGELLRCDDPDSPGRFVVARMIGSSNDKIDVTGDTVRVNERRKPSARACPKVKLVHPTTGQEHEYDCHEEDFAGVEFRTLGRPEAAANAPPFSTVVAPGKVFIISDNRSTHVDSRDFGTVDPNTCKHIVFRLFGEAGWFDTQTRMTLL
ncbi:MAG: signal peptidase I [Polyangiaceae bacterium]